MKGFELLEALARDALEATALAVLEHPKGRVCAAAYVAYRENPRVGDTPRRWPKIIARAVELARQKGTAS